MPVAENLVSDVPDEILENILRLATTSESGWWHPSCTCNTFRGIPSLASVCRRFNRLVTPLLYRVIGVEPHIILRESEYEGQAAEDAGCTQPPTRAVLLHRTLKEKPELRRFCRHLYFYIRDGPQSSESEVKEFELADDFARWLPNVRCLEISGGFERSQGLTWRLIRTAAVHMPLVESVMIKPHVSGLYLPPIVLSLAFPRLQSLELCGVSRYNLGMVPSLRAYGQVSLKSLQLSTFFEGPEGLELLVDWTKTLEHFTFNSLQFEQNQFPWRLSTFRFILLPHRSTLKSICIGALPACKSDRLNFSDFIELETLKLSAWGLDLDTDAQIPGVLAPKLKQFTINFNSNDSTFLSKTRFHHYTPRADDWLRSLGYLAAERRVPLREICIQFEPASWIRPLSTDKYPWDRMDVLRTNLLGLGIDLKYSRPTLTREEFARLIEQEDETPIDWVTYELNSLDIGTEVVAI